VDKAPKRYGKVGNVKYVNIRQLQRNLEESVKELPVIVTRNGQPIFTIIPMGIGLTPGGTTADLRPGRYEGEIDEYYPVKVEEPKK
jgi:antitoxin (DNA-binding transcriptional repressor) of toxin-antitoxin stability system